MIFEEIVIDNFGIYKGRHIINLAPPSREKTIILLGGLNGSGKTTLLDALQVTLYGKFARTSNRGSANYFEYLRRMINYHAERGSALELQFKHFKAGKKESIRVYRSWYSSGKGINETVKVERDGIFDPVITEQWYQYVEELIPARISSLFFFDGEKIEAYAELHKTAELLKTGIHALLGLDLVDRLSIDLLMVERKRKTQLQSQQVQDNIATLETEVAQQENQAQELAHQKKEAQHRLKKLKQSLDNLTNEYRREGGELFDKREQIEAQQQTSRQNLSQLEGQLRELAAGEAPLLMVQKLLRETEKQTILEQEAKRNRTLHEVLEKRDVTLLDFLKQQEVETSTLTVIEAFIEEDKTKRQQSLGTECYLIDYVEPIAFAPLQDNILRQIQVSADTLIAQTEAAIEEINSCERKLAGIPDPESLIGIQEKIQNTQKEIEQTKLRIETLEQEHQRILSRVKQKNTELTRACEMGAEEQFTHETTGRVLKHSAKVRKILEKFGVAVTKKHIRLLERLILESFQQLIRKTQFITEVEIDPNSYTLTLYTAQHKKQSPDSLSAGERQLLVVSILWGLSRASGRPLPAIIDTPLSRLDGEHRQNLVYSYFPHASHQLILLSTDEEINKKYYRTLKPSIGREYHILYEEDKQSSAIKLGYFF